MMIDKSTRFYVYLHKTKDGNVFYVGKGEGGRAWNSTKRSLTWYETVKMKGCIVEVLKWNLSENDALKLEKSLIDSGDYNLINVRQTNQLLELDMDVINALFEYNPESVTGLTWKRDAGRGGTKRRKGEDAGWKTTDGYCRVGIDGKLYLTHRVIWTMHYGNIGDFQINHIDACRSNNRIENLEKVTPSQNSNRKKVSAVPSAVYDKTTGFLLSYRVRFADEIGGRRTRNFNISDYNSASDAYAEADAFRSEMNGKNA